ncbi:VOC family protein [Nocardia neocaledoniensis]|uniref:VOC family protein n=1 Tax=Nocardia neocaledoniensis TaxID=236511 RepID=UPI002458ADDC|nr:VOC family protein [Nocardia neocaledoniensis]
MTNTSQYLKGGIRQLAFVVPDAAEAARQHAEVNGSGPFYVMPRYKMLTHEYRGVSNELEVTSAYGQWGEIMVEFVQMHNDNPSAFRDSYPDGGPGMHHAAIFCTELKEAVAAFEADGYPITMYAERIPGADYAMMDTRSALGFMTELYEERVVAGFYAMIRDAAKDWDGTDPVRVREYDAFLASGS